MSPVRAPRSAANLAATPAVTAAVLLLTLTGCAAADRDPAGGAGPAPSISSAAGGAPPDAVQEACARVLETVRSAPRQLREDPAGLFAEVDELAATAPDELSGQLASLREAVAGFRQGERSLLSVVQEIRGLQERCSG